MGEEAGPFSSSSHSPSGELIPERQSGDDCIIQCLKLRHWALSLLSGATPPAEAANVPPVTRAAWELFLAIESVAGALEKALGAQTLHLPLVARAAITNEARRELQRVMAARAQLRAIDEWTANAGCHPVVLKGGVHAVDGGESFDLGDIDLLVSSAERESLIGILTEHGYAVDAATGNLHLAGGIPVELHTSLDVGHDIAVISDTPTSARIPGWRALRRLDAASHLIHCIQHSTSKHPHRRGHLRDLIQIADALADCGNEELARVDALLRSSATGVYRETLDAASRLRARGGDSRDAFTAMAAGMYAMGRWFPPAVSQRYPAQLYMVSHFLASRSEAIRSAREYLSGKYSGGADQKARLRTALRAPQRLVVLTWTFVLSAFITLRWSTHWRPMSRR